jgi:hypothetical protein
MMALKRSIHHPEVFPPGWGASEETAGGMAVFCEGHLRMTDRGLGVMLCSPRQGRFGRRPARRIPGGEVSVFGVPFRARAAHVVPVRPIRTAGSAAFRETLPQLAYDFNHIAPHQTLPFAHVRGVFLGRRFLRTAVLFSNDRFIRVLVSNLKKWCDCGRPQTLYIKNC